ncbi:MAG: DUF2232 domain-containing protein [Halanaerobiales bacterium]
MNVELGRDLFKTIAVLVFFSFLFFLLPLSIFVNIIWPIPIVYLIMKQDVNQSLKVILITALVNTLLLGVMLGINYGLFMGFYTIVGFGLVGFLLGSGLKERFSPRQTMILTIIAFLISNIIILISIPYMFDINYHQFLQQYLQETFRLFEESPLSGEMGAFVSPEIMITIIETLYPSFLVITSIITGILTYYISIWYLKRKEVPVDAYKSIKNWSFPAWKLSLAVILTMALITIFKYGQSNGLQDILSLISSNIFVVLMFLLFLQGFAVIIYYISRVNSITLYILFGFTALFLYHLIIILGLLDLWFDFRKNKT